MNKVFVPLLLIAALATTNSYAADTYTIDPTHSLQIFKYRHLGLSFARGRFDKTSGTITLDAAQKTGSADITIDVNSVNTGIAKLDEHLKGKDFFDAEQFPVISFKSTAFTFKGGKPVTIKGDLTVHGVTQPVTLKVTNFACKEHPMMKIPACAANATAQIKRSAFGVNGYVPAVSDEVELDLEVEALRQLPEPPAQATK
jgi:polyisoprenoid-binding protein YceI